ncbi:S41 family peptidase [Mucilaginibacter sp. dw_454]|uniref:S41 family peptidase n=1 Tax=Mucilaginibacter sp. dw_454 TaxID=2720079 RepID=UPI001BD2337E|nr:S41 family peptidase [Mucilaginibacter sp. dw_454]
MKTSFIITSICLLLIFINCKPNALPGIDDKISADSLKADFKEITSNIETKVPTPFYLCPKSTYDSIKQTVEASLNKPMTVIEFYQKVSPMFMLLKDGHFQFFLSKKLVENLEQKNPELYFPFTVFIDHDRIFVDSCLRSDATIKKGTEILAINTVSSKDILNKLRYGVALKSNEENYFERRNEDRFYRSLLQGMGFRNNFSVKFAGKTVDTKGVSAKVVATLDDDGHDFSYKIAEGKDGIAYLGIKDLLTENRKKLDSGLKIFFKAVKQQHVNKLIIDIRNNYGGSTKLARDVFDYITDKKYLMDTGEESLQNSKKIFEIDTVPSIPKPMADKFMGKTILLTNVLCYSSAHMMANTFQYYKMGTVIGQISTEPLFISGEIQEGITSNTQSRAYFPTTNFYLPGYQKDKVTYFVPDYQVYPTIKERVTGKDAAVDLAIKMLGSNHQAKTR